MSDINEVRERLERDAADPAIPYTVVCAGSDIRALLADHARLQTLIDAQANNLNEQLGISEELPLAIDLEQFRVAVGYMIDCAETDSELSHVRRLLALIDGQDKCVGELSLTDAISDYLEAQDALDNWETAGPNRDLYESAMARRNAARRDLESALSPTKGEGE